MVCGVFNVWNSMLNKCHYYETKWNEREWEKMKRNQMNKKGMI
jgi:hypothetical protein